MTGLARVKLPLSTDIGNALWARGIVADSHKPGNNTAETRLPGCGRGSRQNRDDRGAAAGILVNGVTALLFARGRKGDLNVKGAFLHMAADAAVSAGVVVSGLVILLTGWARLDPVREAIKRRDAKGEPVREIARTFNVSHSTISRLHA
jgi:helix-turn-helix protein